MKMCLLEKHVDYGNAITADSLFNLEALIMSNLLVGTIVHRNFVSSSSLSRFWRCLKFILFVSDSVCYFVFLTTVSLLIIMRFGQFSL